MLDSKEISIPQAHFNWATSSYFNIHRKIWGGFPGGLAVKNPPAMQETQVQSLGREDPLEEEMAAHSNILAWRIPQTEAPGRLQSAGLQKIWTWPKQLEWNPGGSLVVQWLRIHLPMQEIWISSLIQEDSTCLRAAEPGATPTEPVLWSPCSAVREARTPQPESTTHSPQSKPMQQHS